MAKVANKVAASSTSTTSKDDGFDFSKDVLIAPPAVHHFRLSDGAEVDRAGSAPSEGIASFVISVRSYDGTAPKMCLNKGYRVAKDNANSLAKLVIGEDGTVGLAEHPRLGQFVIDGSKWNGRLPVSIAARLKAHESAYAYRVEAALAAHAAASRKVG